MDAHHHRQTLSGVARNARRVDLSGFPARIGSCSRPSEQDASLPVVECPTRRQVEKGAQHRAGFGVADLVNATVIRAGSDMRCSHVAKFLLPMPFGNR